jgi:hypothetical protein
LSLGRSSLPTPDSRPFAWNLGEFHSIWRHCQIPTVPSRAIQTDDSESPLAELQQIVDALEEADPEDVADLASHAIAVLQRLGGSATDDDGHDDSDDELEAKAAALRLRMKMLR